LPIISRAQRAQLGEQDIERLGRQARVDRGLRRPPLVVARQQRGQHLAGGRGAGLLRRSVRGFHGVGYGAPLQHMAHRDVAAKRHVVRAVGALT
jgi:hypothetical protein